MYLTRCSDTLKAINLIVCFTHSESINIIFFFLTVRSSFFYSFLIGTAFITVELHSKRHAAKPTRANFEPWDVEIEQLCSQPFASCAENKARCRNNKYIENYIVFFLKKSLLQLISKVCWLRHHHVPLCPMVTHTQPSTALGFRYSRPI